ncbi:hypothetical protein [Streptomyces profundus]|uniref:hypothetical protein n=1 Tax=Streptomyces profundus TaxID=2867410 RepID=UPI001D16B692|nr:hypothetical protein [Streptomyces sp. MA3_2.13]UED84227.1 hypothetical protein K4G22_08400 [Streptomyces sp. MA3_2.13]
MTTSDPIPQGPPTPPQGPPPHAPPPSGPRPPAVHGRAPAEHAPRYLIAGVLLLLFAGGVSAWVITGVNDSWSSPGDLFQALLFDPLRQVHPLALTPYEWVFAAALLTVGVLALCQRQVARGGALVLAFLLLGLCLRQAVGALDDRYRAGFEVPDYGAWTLVTYASGLAIAIALLLLLLPAGERGRAATAPGPSPTGRRLLGIGGGLMIVLALVDLAWVLDNQRLAAEYGWKSWTDYFRDLVDPALFHSPTSLTSGIGFYEAALPISLLAVGALAVAGRPVARGGGLALAGMLFYLELRQLIGVIREDSWDHLLETTRGTLLLTTVLVSVAALLATVGALAAAGSRGHAGGAPSPHPWPHPGPRGW